MTKEQKLYRSLIMADLKLVEEHYDDADKALQLQAAYKANEAGILWYMNEERIILVALPEIQPKKMQGFLDKNYVVRHLDKITDITAIYGNIIQQLNLNQISSRIVTDAASRLAKKYKEYYSLEASEE